MDAPCYRAYTVYNNLIVAPAGLNAVTGDLGAVDGDDKHCRRVCGVVPGCNMITPPTPAHNACFIRGVCPKFELTLRATTPGGALPKRRNLRSPQLLLLLAAPLIHEACLRLNHWGKLDYRLLIEGAHLGVVSASMSPSAARSATWFLAATRSRGRKGPRRAVPHEGRCATREDTRLDAADATPAMRQKLMRFRNGRYTLAPTLALQQ